MRPFPQATVSADAPNGIPLHEHDDPRSRIAARILEGETVYILAHNAPWVYIGYRGVVGYVRLRDIALLTDN